MVAWVTAPAACLFRPRALPARLDVHVWGAVLPDTPFTTALLSPIEREHAEKLDNVKRLRFVQTRTFVRRVLSTYIPNVAANPHLVIDKNKYGKPYLPHHENLQFNTAHTGDKVAVAVCRDVSVGIDIELVNRTVRNIDRLAKRYLSAVEQASLYGEVNGDQDLLRRNFLKLWTCKEAFVKCVGTGIAAGDLSSVEISMPHNRPPRLISLNRDAAHACEFSFQSLDTNELYTTVAIAAAKFGKVVPVDVGMFVE